MFSNGINELLSHHRVDIAQDLEVCKATNCKLKESIKIYKIKIKELNKNYKELEQNNNNDISESVESIKQKIEEYKNKIQL